MVPQRTQSQIGREKMALLLAVDAAMRRNLRRNRIFRDRINPLEQYDDVDLMKRFRMPRHVILEVINLIETEIEHPTQRSHAIPASLQVLCALRYYATGNFQFVSVNPEVARLSPAPVILSLFIQNVSKNVPVSFPCGLLHDIYLKKSYPLMVYLLTASSQVVS